MFAFTLNLFKFNFSAPVIRLKAKSLKKTTNENNIKDAMIPPNKIGHKLPMNSFILVVMLTKIAIMRIADTKKPIQKSEIVLLYFFID